MAIMNYSLPDYMENDLLSAYENNKKLNNQNASITIYSPYLLNEKRLNYANIVQSFSPSNKLFSEPLTRATESSIYYTGYLGYKYRDDMYMYIGTSNWTRLFTTENLLQQVLTKQIKTIILSEIDDITTENKYASMVFSLYQLYSSWKDLTVVDVTPEDKLEVKLVERKWQKSTSIYFNGYYDLGCRSQQSWMNWKNSLSIGGDVDIRDTDVEHTKLDGYDNSDYWAWINKGTLETYKQEITNYTYKDYPYTFRSLF